MARRLNYSGRTLTGLELSGRIFYDANFSNATLINVNMSNKNFTRANFSGATLRGITFDSTTLNYTNFTGANLTNASLTDADLDNANLTNANLSGADLTNASLDHANLTNANLSNAILVNAESTADINLDNANFTGSNLSNTCLIAPISARNVNFTNVTFNRRSRLPQIDELESPIGISPELREFITSDTNRQECYEETDDDFLERADRLEQERIARGQIPRQQVQVQVQNQGVAFEIHNAFANFNMSKYNEIINGFLLEKGETIDKSISDTKIKESYKDIVNKYFPDNEKVNAKRKLDEILNIATRTMYFQNDKKNIIISNTVKFIGYQSPKFKTEYMKMFIQDCYNAYSVVHREGDDQIPNNAAGMSCAKGIIERIVLTVCNTSQVLCMNRTLCQKNPIYGRLKSIIEKELDINELTQEWSETDDLNTLTTSAELRSSFINYLTRKYQEAGIEESVYSPKIERQANDIQYVFDQPLGQRAFGGNKSRGNKRRNKKYTKKTNRRRKNKTRSSRK